MADSGYLRDLKRRLFSWHMIAMTAAAAARAVGRFAPSAWIRLRRLTTRMCRGSQIYFRPLQDPSAPCDRHLRRSSARADNRYQAGSSRSFATVYERLIRDQNCLHEAPAFGVAPLFIWRKANTEKKSPPAASQPGALLFFLRDSIAGWAVPYPPLPVPGALPPVSAAPPGAPQAPAPDETMHQGRAQA